jgi:hypothetical protein
MTIMRSSDSVSIGFPASSSPARLRLHGQGKLGPHIVETIRGLGYRLGRAGT